MTIFSRHGFSNHLSAAISSRIPRARLARHRQLRYESLECRNLLAGDLLLTGSQLQNPLIPLDTNDDSAVSPIDALIVINQIAFALGEGEDGPTSPAGTYPDVNGDQSITTVDAQIVIDYLSNSGSTYSPMPGASCGDVPAAAVTIDTLPADVNELQVFTVSGTMPNAYGVQVDMGLNWQTLDFVSDAATFTWSTTGFYSDDDATGTPSDSRSVVLHALNICHSASASASLVVHNIDPTISLSAPSAIDEGSEIAVVLTFGDATNTAYVGGAYSADTWTIVVDWGDGSSSTFSNLAGGYYGPYSPFQSITATHVYVDDDPTSTPQDIYSITATIVDDDTGMSTTTASITVNNVAPTVTIDSVTAIDKVLATDEDGNATQWLNPGQLDESEGFIVRGSVTDPGVADTVTATLEVDLNFDGDTLDNQESFTVLLTPDTTHFGRWTFEHLIAVINDDGPSPGNGTAEDSIMVSAHVEDDDTGYAWATKSAVVKNVSPMFSSMPQLQLDTGVDNEGNTVVLSTASGKFFDPGNLDRHSVVALWSDGVETSMQLDSTAQEFFIARNLGAIDTADLSVMLSDLRITDDDLGQVSIGLGCGSEVIGPPSVAAPTSDAEGEGTPFACNATSYNPPTFVLLPTVSKNLGFEEAVTLDVYKNETAKIQDQAKAANLKNYDSVVFLEMETSLSGRMLGTATFALAVKYDNNYTSEGVCDMSATKFAFMPIKIVFKETNAAQSVHVGNGTVLAGPKSISEHESWHIDGPSKAILEAVAQPAKRVGFIKHAGVEFDDAMKRLDEAAKTFLKRIRDQADGQKQCDKLAKFVADEIWLSRNTTLDIKLGGAWHTTSTNVNADYDYYK